MNTRLLVTLLYALTTLAFLGGCVGLAFKCLPIHMELSFVGSFVLGTMASMFPLGLIYVVGTILAIYANDQEDYLAKLEALRKFHDPVCWVREALGVLKARFS